MGLKIHKRKTKIMKVNAASNSSPIVLRGTTLEEVDTFTYLGSIVNKVGGTDEDIKTRIQKIQTRY